MIPSELRIEAMLQDLENIVQRPSAPANDEPEGYRAAKVSESELLRQIRIRIARFRQGY